MTKLIRLFVTALPGAILVFGSALPVAAAPGDCAQDVAHDQPNTNTGSGTQDQFAECSPQSTP